jgi:hypothetical protein
MTEAFSNVIPLSNALIFAAVGVFASRSSAIAPTISCPSGAYACSGVANRMLRKIATIMA